MKRAPNTAEQEHVDEDEDEDEYETYPRCTFRLQTEFAIIVPIFVCPIMK